MLKQNAKYSDTQLREAIRMVTEDRKSIGKSAAINAVPKSTLSFKLRKFEDSKKKMGAPTKLTVDNEKAILHWCINRAKMGKDEQYL